MGDRENAVQVQSADITAASASVATPFVTRPPRKLLPNVGDFASSSLGDDFRIPRPSKDILTLILIFRVKHNHPILIIMQVTLLRVSRATTVCPHVCAGSHTPPHMPLIIFFPSVTVSN